MAASMISYPPRGSAGDLVPKEEFFSSCHVSSFFDQKGYQQLTDNKRGKKGSTISSSRNYVQVCLIERIFRPHAKLRVGMLREKGKSAGHEGAPMAHRKVLRAFFHAHALTHTSQCLERLSLRPPLPAQKPVV